MNITRLIAQAYAKMISESHTAKEIAGTPTAELRKLAATYERSASDHGVKYEAAKKAGDSNKAEEYKAKMFKHQDEAEAIRTELGNRLKPKK